MAQERVTLKHKDLGDRTITVPKSSAKVLEKSGWKTAPKSQQPDTQGGSSS